MPNEKFHHDVTVQLRDLALSFPEVEEGDSCVNRRFAVRKKAFLFLGESEAGYKLMVKLGSSVGEAEELAGSQPGIWSVGKGGWTTVKLLPDQRPREGVLERWVEESYRLQAPKVLSEALAR